MEIKKAECVFKNRTLDTSLMFERKNEMQSKMERIALCIREQAVLNGGGEVPEDIQDAYWKIWWYLDCPPYCFHDV